MSKIIKLVFTIKSIIFLVGGIMLTIHGYKSYSKLNETENWKTTTAIIKNVAVRALLNNDSTLRFEPRLQYEYAYNKETYTDSTYMIGTTENMHQEWQVEQFLETYTIGDTINIFVNPDVPQEATFKKGKVGQEIFALCCGIFMIIIGYLLRMREINRLFLFLIEKIKPSSKKT